MNRSARSGSAQNSVLTQPSRVREEESTTMEIRASPRHADARSRPIDGEEAGPTTTLLEQMKEVKATYPGAKTWAKDEERLFELLFLRQDLPIMPRHWCVDLRGLPVAEKIFDTSNENPPVIYAHCKNGTKEYLATMGITNLVDITLSVRSVLEAKSLGRDPDPAEVRQRTSELIKNALDQALVWAARDGGYDRLRVVPNIVAEIVDVPESHDNVVQFLRGRMRALVQLQQKFYRVDRSADFWSVILPRLAGSRSRPRSSSRRRFRAGMKRARSKFPGTPDSSRQKSATTSSPDIKLEHRATKRRMLDSPSAGLDKKAELGGNKAFPVVKREYTEETPSEPDVMIKQEPAEDEQAVIEPPQAPPPQVAYRRRPPVVYGLYVLGTAVFLLTADSSRGLDGYISFHVEVNFADNHQSVWNALTVAMAVCLARDELMTRVDDFEPLPVIYESDPDA